MSRDAETPSQEGGAGAAGSQTSGTCRSISKATAKGFSCVGGNTMACGCQPKLSLLFFQFLLSSSGTSLSANKLRLTFTEHNTVHLCFEPVHCLSCFLTSASVSSEFLVGDFDMASAWCGHSRETRFSLKIVVRVARESCWRLQWLSVGGGGVAVTQPHECVPREMGEMSLQALCPGLG